MDWAVDRAVVKFCLGLHGRVPVRVDLQDGCASVVLADLALLGPVYGELYVARGFPVARIAAIPALVEAVRDGRGGPGAVVVLAGAGRSSPHRDAMRYAQTSGSDSSRGKLRREVREEGLIGKAGGCSDLVFGLEVYETGQQQERQ